ncbi:hypothetical protein FB451DRAFT_1092397, partial [Mycena latifolia]
MVETSRRRLSTFHLSLSAAATSTLTQFWTEEVESDIKFSGAMEIEFAEQQRNGDAMQKTVQLPNRVRFQASEVDDCSWDMSV